MSAEALVSSAAVKVSICWECHCLSLLKLAVSKSTITGLEIIKDGGESAVFWIPREAKGLASVLRSAVVAG